MKVAHSAEKVDVAMTLFLISLGMLFGTLLLAYTIGRINEEMWPVLGGGQLPLLNSTVSTIIIVLSSFSYHKFQGDILGREEMGSAKRMLQLTLLLAIGFGVGQVALWFQLQHQGFHAYEGIFQSFVYTLPSIHAIHIFLGLLALIFLYRRTFRRSCIADHQAKNASILIVNTGKFWHFLTIIWILMYIALFLI